MLQVACISSKTIVKLPYKILEFDWLKNIWQKIQLPQHVHKTHPPSDYLWQQLTMHDNVQIVNCAEFCAYSSPLYSMIYIQSSLVNPDTLVPSKIVRINEASG
jgi:hypothetical protein